MRKITGKLAFFAAILVPVLVVFHSLFVPGPLAWGDAPHFFNEELPDLVGKIIPEPIAWVSRGHNFGGANFTLWLYPLMFLYRYLALVLGNDLTIRILFYFPAILLAGIGPVLLTRHLKLSSRIQFFASLFYLLNSYFILLVDGGQAGMVLAYGLFPIVLFLLISNNFWPALLSTFLLTIADPRVAAICFLTALIWNFNLKNCRYYFFLLLSLLGLTAYWWWPLIKSQEMITLGDPDLVFVKLRHAITLFNPHWPENIFGKVRNPELYFYGLSVLILGNLIWAKKRKLIIIFLIFAALTAGIYLPLVDKIPFGFAFRDSTKFFSPAILLGGILIGQTVERFKSKFKIAEIVVFGYLLFLILPALLGNLNFVLSGKQHSSDYQKIYENLKADDSFYRSAWFPERHPLTFETEEKPALDAKDLVNLRPLAAINTGTFDLFNFIHNENFLDWFDLLGIKYLIFPGDARNPLPNEEEKAVWQDLSDRTATVSGLIKQDWGTDVAVYKNPETMPRIFTTNQLSIVVGPPLQISPKAEPLTVFVEDGQWDPHDLEGILGESAKVVFNGKDETDLAMSFLQNYFVGPLAASQKQWAVYGADEFLVYKYQLLIRDFIFNDFDYGKGIAFSTQKGEKMVFNLQVPADDSYVLAIRRADEKGSLRWEITDLGAVKKGHREIVIENDKDLSVFNLVALVPKSDFDEAIALARTFVLHFGLGDKKETPLVWEKVGVEKQDATRYKLDLEGTSNWVVLTDSYHPDWKLSRGNLSYPALPAHSMINVFYRRTEWDQVELIFAGQETLRTGAYLTIVSGLVLAIIFLWKRK